jgi:hypothetical protein
MTGKCKRCFKTYTYINQYEALACLRCNYWLENVCDDEDCDFCSFRPTRPITAFWAQQEADAR